MMPFTFAHTDEERPDGWSFDLWKADSADWTLAHHRATWVQKIDPVAGAPLIGTIRPPAVRLGGGGWRIQVIGSDNEILSMTEPGWLSTDLLLKRIAAGRWTPDKSQAYGQLLVLARSRQEDLRAEALELENVILRISQDMIHDCDAGTCRHVDCAAKRVAARRLAAKHASRD